MAREDIPRRIRDPRTGETPEPPQKARADDPTHGVDPNADRPSPFERPGLSGQNAHRGAMQMADQKGARRNIVPTLGVALVLVGIFVAVTLIWM